MAGAGRSVVQREAVQSGQTVVVSSGIPNHIVYLFFDNMDNLACFCCVE